MNLNDISKTALATLKCHVIDSKNKNSILGDVTSVRMFEYLQANLNIQNDLKVNQNLVTHICLRAKQYDMYIRNFCQQFPDSVIINAGCGFDNRFIRIDNGMVKFYDLDLPEVISLKKKVFQENERYKYIPDSVFNHNWIKTIPQKPLMIVAEGLFMYFDEKEIKNLFSLLNNRFDYVEMICEVVNSKWLQGWRKKSLDIKLKRQLKFGKNAEFKFGIPYSKYFETWNADFKFLDEWSYLDTNHPSLGLLRYLKKSEKFRKVQWTVHYQLAGSST